MSLIITQGYGTSQTVITQGYGSGGAIIPVVTTPIQPWGVGVSGKRRIPDDFFELIRAYLTAKNPQ
jgi:hypothetical protein